MEETAWWVKEWHGSTWIHPLGLTMLAIAAIATLTLPRRQMLWPVVWIGCLVAPAQRIVIFGMDWTILRLTLLAALIRCLMLIADPKMRPKRQKVDVWFTLWLASGVLIYVLREPNGTALMNRLGWAFEYFTAYLIVRVAVRSWDDLKSLTLGASLISIPIAVAFLNEQLTQYNIFSIFGGVREITWVRYGRLRCQGAYAHPILAGTYWAVFIPLIFSQLWMKNPGRKFLGVFATLCGVLIIVTCASSGPVASLLAAIIAGLMVKFRNAFHEIRLAGAGLLVFLHFAMEAPVWHLISRIDIVGGSTGWHRYNLFNQWITNWDNWFLLGTSSTASWSAWPVSDITNQYVLEAIRGGLLSLVFFVGMLTCAYIAVGKAARVCERAKRPAEFAMTWAIGCALFVHTISFFGVSYFGQILLLLAMFPALAGSLEEITEPARRAARRARRAPRPRAAPTRNVPAGRPA